MPYLKKKSRAWHLLQMPLDMERQNYFLAGGSLTFAGGALSAPGQETTPLHVQNSLQYSTNHIPGAPAGREHHPGAAGERRTPCRDEALKYAGHWESQICKKRNLEIKRIEFTH